jgi:hypothetical protein
VLAYVQGEEDFDDANRNNVYDAGEPFTDLGNAYRSDINNFSDRNGPVGLPSDNAKVSNYSFRQALDFSVPRAGNTTCVGGESGVANTCDGVWGGNEVRKQHLIIFASSGAVFNRPVLGSTVAATVTVAGVDTVVFYRNSFAILVQDVNGNSIPTGSTISAVKGTGSDGCTVRTTLPNAIGNTYDPTIISVGLDKCLVSDSIDVIVTTPVTKTGTIVRVPLN